MAKPTCSQVGRPLKFKTPQELEDKIQAYMEKCDEREVPYTIEGLAVACECDRQTILNYSYKDEYFGTINKYKAKILAQLQELALVGKTNATVTIFNLKNNYDYADKQEIKQDIDLKVKGLDDFYEA